MREAKKGEERERERVKAIGGKKRRKGREYFKVGARTTTLQV